MTVTATAMYDKLATSGLNKNDAKRLHVRFLKPTQTARLTEQRFEVGAMQLPYFEPDGRQNHFWRLRLLESPAASFRKKTPRYTQPPDTQPRVYLPPLLDKNLTWSDVAADGEQPIIVTEGELKAACATKYALPTIGLGGVWSWRTKKRGMAFLPDLEAFVWEGRDVYLVFDSDLSTNTQVRAALHALSRELADRGASVFIAYLPGLPEHDGKTGLDDYVVARGAAAFLDVLRRAEEFELARALHELNEEVAYVEDPGLVVRLRDGLQWRPGDFTSHALANRSYLEVNDEGKAKKKPLAPAWLKWPGRLTLSRFVYEPGEERITAGGAYNLWRGWGAAPKKGDVSRWHRLMDHVFGTDAEARRWFERWCAIQFQRPGVKLYTSVLLWSVETGTGKSLVGVSLGKIFGENFVELNESMLTGAFNGWAKGKQFALGDEVTGNDSRQFADMLKAMITRTTIHINAKYMPVYETADVINYLFTSNHPDAFFMDDRDRRNFVYEITAGALPLDFALDYDEWIHRGPGPSALFDYFLHVDLGDFHPQGRAPMTVAKENMIYHAKSDLDRWVADLVADPDAVLRVDGVATAAELWTPAQLLRIYDPLEKTRVTVNAVGKALRRAGVPALPVVRTSAGATRLYAVRNGDKWRKAKPKDIKDAFEKGPGGRRKKY